MKNKKSNPYFKIRSMYFQIQTMPEESEGICKKCKVFTILGDGYCIHCWDKTTGAARNYVSLE